MAPAAAPASNQPDTKPGVTGSGSSGKLAAGKGAAGPKVPQQQHEQQQQVTRGGLVLRSDPPVPRSLMGSRAAGGGDNGKAAGKPAAKSAARPAGKLAGKPAGKPAVGAAPKSATLPAAADEDDDEDKPPKLDRSAAAARTLSMIADTLATGYRRLGATFFSFDYGGAATRAVMAGFVAIRDADYAEMGRSGGAALSAAIRTASDSAAAAYTAFQELEPAALRVGVNGAFATARQQIAGGWGYVKREVLALEREVEEFDAEKEFQRAEKFVESELDPAQNPALAKAEADFGVVLVTKPYEEILAPLADKARAAADAAGRRLQSLGLGGGGGGDSSGEQAADGQVPQTLQAPGMAAPSSDSSNASSGDQNKGGGSTASGSGSGSGNNSSGQMAEPTPAAS